jgi:superoxide dismutase
MADSRIPLGINQLDISGPLAIKRQGEIQGYEMQRQQGIDQLNQQQHAQNQELGGLQIEQIKKQMAQLPPEQVKLAMQQITTDTFALQSLVKSGDTEAALMVANGLKQTGRKSAFLLRAWIISLS